MPDQIPLNADAVESAVTEVYGDGPRMDWPSDMTGYQTHRDYARSIVKQIVSAYLAVAQPVVNSVEELVTTPAGRALANAGFNEGLSAGIRACNESREGEPFVKPVSPYRAEVKP